MSDATSEIDYIEGDFIRRSDDEHYPVTKSDYESTALVTRLGDGGLDFNYFMPNRKYAEIRTAVENDKGMIRSALLTNGVNSGFIDAVFEYSKLNGGSSSALTSISEAAEGLSSPSPEVMAKVKADLFGVGYFSPEKISGLEVVSIYRFMAFIANPKADIDNRGMTIAEFNSPEFESKFQPLEFNLDKLIDVGQFNLKTIPPIDIRFSEKENQVFLTLLCSSTDKLDATISFWNGMIKRVNPRIGLMVSCAIGSAGAVDDVQLKYYSNAAKKLDIVYSSKQDDTYSTRLFNEVLVYACKTKCSDIHLTPCTNNFGLIRVRQDGAIRILKVTSGETINSIYNKLLNQSGIADGQNTTPVPIPQKDLPEEIRDRFSLRIQASKTVRGYGIVIRVLDNKSNSSELDTVGLDEIYDDLLWLCKLPHGLVLITGPTGSGKTTTLYAMLKQIDGLHSIIHSIENPVEYKCSMWHQHQLSSTSKESEEGEGMMEFMKGLLRNDIDTGLVGEIRDKGSADKSIQLASTGHLVFSTLHTNSAAKTITRVSEMGVNMPAFSDVIKAILAQRLVRTLCDHCKVEIVDTGEDSQTYSYLLGKINENNLNIDLAEKKVYKASPCGCMYCNDSGYRGRKAVYELMLVNDDVASSIMSGTSGIEIAKKYMPFNKRMLSRGLSLVFAGLTSLEEVLSAVDG